jgi:hypothetical protein
MSQPKHARAGFARKEQVSTLTTDAETAYEWEDDLGWDLVWQLVLRGRLTLGVSDDGRVAVRVRDSGTLSLDAEP